MRHLQAIKRLLLWATLFIVLLIFTLGAVMAQETGATDPAETNAPNLSALVIIVGLVAIAGVGIMMILRERFKADE